MTGNANAGYDGDRQGQAASKVAETWEAVTGSRKHTSALEAKMHAAMTRFTGTEYENELALKKLQADEQAQAIRSQKPGQFDAMIRRFGLTFADLGFDAALSSAPPAAPSTAPGAPSGVTSNTGPVTQDAQPEA